jgi:tetratricopeptide (TPR) repeat protein
LLEEAARFYGDLEKLLEGQVDPKSRRLLAAGYFQLANLTEKIGDNSQALAVHRQALAVRRELAAQPEADVETRLDVPRSLKELGRLMGVLGEWKSAIATLEELDAIALALEPESRPGEALELAAHASRQRG